MNGAHALVRTLVDTGVEVCFTNPGTSEMHFVAALDSAPQLRAVLCLFEGVATGAADGYARMAGKPAATLLHLGCGLGNGLANLHNARKGKVPVINIVGDPPSEPLPADPATRDSTGGTAGAANSQRRANTSSGRIKPRAMPAVGSNAIRLAPAATASTRVLPSPNSPAAPKPSASMPKPRRIQRPIWSMPV